jgi:hypothetical protein
MAQRKETARAIGMSVLILLSLFLIGALLTSCSGSGGRITSYGLTAEDLVISHEKDGPPGEPRTFHPGDKIYLRFSLSDYKLDSEGNLWIQEDLVMNDPNGVSVLTRANLIDDRVPPPEGAKSVPVNNTITLFDTAQPGKYTIAINVRDKIGGGAVYIEAEVTVQSR